MNKKIIVIGAGENGNVAANCLSYHYTIHGFLDDKKNGDQVLGIIQDYKKYIDDFMFFVSIGELLVRKKVFVQLIKDNAEFANAIHPTAIIEKSVKLGKNVFIGAGTYININSQIGDNSIINNSCVIEHDTTISPHTHLAPGVITGGGVHVGESSFIGLGTIINDHITIGCNTIIGSGSVVTTDIPNHVTAVGIPAKVIKHNNE